MSDVEDPVSEESVNNNRENSKGSDAGDAAENAVSDGEYEAQSSAPPEQRDNQVTERSESARGAAAESEAQSKYNQDVQRPMDDEAASMLSQRQSNAPDGRKTREEQIEESQLYGHDAASTNHQQQRPSTSSDQQFPESHHNQHQQENLMTSGPIRRQFNDPIAQQQQRIQEDSDRLKELMINICSFLEENYMDQVRRIVMDRDPQLHYDVEVDLLQFLYHYPYEGSRFHDYPREFLKFLKKCLTAVQSKIIASEEEHVRQFLTLKKHLDVRLSNVPPLKEITLDSIRNIRQCHVNKYMVVYGTVIRCTSVKNRETKKDFACKNCGKIYTAKSDILEYNAFKLPPVCGGEVEKPHNPFISMLNAMKKKGTFNKAAFGGTHIGQCNSRVFLPIHGTARYKDYQEIKIQEVYKTLEPGLIPRSIIIIIEDNLVDICKPGDDVMVSGILIQRWKSPFMRLDRPEIEVSILGNNLSVLNKRDFNIKQEINQQACSDFKNYWKSHEKNVLEGKNKILESICPHIYERYPEKLGLLLAIIGGVPKQSGDDPKIRGQIHMLMIGEPGTGKSQLLQYAQKVSLRSVQTTGIGTSAAGLTVAAFKDGNEWILEAGALVLADCGVCCIDEFSLIRPEDRGSVHEAMEQQTISIAKAGVCCKINSRCTILAATNPSKTQKWNNRYDNNQNTGIASSLLSRFDLIFILVDQQNTDYDLAQANFKLAFSRNEEEDEMQVDWPVDKLTKYIVFVQRYIEPVCTEEAEMIFQAYFSYLRGRTTLTKDRKTIRMLESLIRLAEAHARLMFRKDIIIYDAISVVILMEHCINTGLFDENYPIVMSRQMYEKAKDEALTKLGLDPSYFSEEFDNYGEGHIKEQVNAMGEETRMNLDTSYYNGEKTEYTVDHRTHISGNMMHQGQGTHVKNEQMLTANEATHYEMGTHVPDNANLQPMNHPDQQHHMQQQHHHMAPQMHMQSQATTHYSGYHDPRQPASQYAQSVVVDADEVGDGQSTYVHHQYGQQEIKHEQGRYAPHQGGNVIQLDQNGQPYQHNGVLTEQEKLEQLKQENSQRDHHDQGAPPPGHGGVM